MRKFLKFVVCPAVLAPGAVLAQDGVAQDEDAIVLWDERQAVITVTADGLGTPVEDTGQSISVLEREDIEQVQGADMLRVFERLPGVTVSRNGPVGSVSGLFVRGANAEQLLVLVDGVPVDDPAAPSGGYNVGNLLSGAVGRVDLLRGSNSVIWGSDAIGGVLDISTRADTGASASIEYGARDTLSASARGGVADERYFAGLSASWYESDGFSAAANGTERDGFEQLALGGSAFYDLTDSVEVFVNARYAEGELEYDGFPAPLFALADTPEIEETEQFSGAAGLAYYGNDLTLRTAYSRSDTLRENFASRGGASTFASDGEAQRVSVRGSYRLIGGLTADFGGEHEWSSYETAFDPGEDTHTTGGYAQLGWERGALAAHIGARLDDHADFGSEESFGADVSYEFGGDWRARASFGEGFKAPSLFQLHSDFGNRTLTPETSTSVDIGLEYGDRRGAVFLAVTGFHRDTEDQIEFVSCFGSVDPICTARPFGTYDNVGRVRAQGFEAEMALRPAENFAVQAVYGLIDTENRTPGDPNRGNALARRPRHALTFAADWETGLLARSSTGGLALGADIRLVGDSFENAANTRPLDGYEVVTVRAELPLGERLELFGRVENLFDAEYQTAAGYATAGRGGFVGVRVRM